MPAATAALLLWNAFGKFLFPLGDQHVATSSQERKGQTTKLFGCSTLGIFELMTTWCLVFRGVCGFGFFVCGFGWVFVVVVLGFLFHCCCFCFGRIFFASPLQVPKVAFG